MESNGTLHPIKDLARAITDHVRGELSVRFKELEAGVIASVSAAAAQVAHKSVTELIDRKFAEMERSQTKAIEETRAAYESRFEKLLIQSQVNLLSAIKSLAAPQVNVTLPDGAIQIKQLPAQVHLPAEAIKVLVNQAPAQVTLPEHAIKVLVNQQPAQVVLPPDSIKVLVEQKAAQVVVSEKAFNLQLPPTRQRVTKSIVYDSTTGRPVKMIEDIEES